MKLRRTCIHETDCWHLAKRQICLVVISVFILQEGRWFSQKFKCLPPLLVISLLPLTQFRHRDMSSYDLNELIYAQNVFHCFLLWFIEYSLDSVVGIVTGCGLDGQGIGVRVPVGARILSFPLRSDRFWDPPSPLPVQWIPGIKRPGREADSSHPISAEVTNAWIYTSTPPYAFIAYCLIN
jgi:hypothetical protein